MSAKILVRNLANLNNNLNIKELKFATYFMLGLLLDEKTHSKIQITLRITKDSGRDLMGMTYCLTGTNDTFRIDLAGNLSKRKMLVTLAHELVHVKQFALSHMGNLIQTKSGEYVRWKNQYIALDYPYYDTPWEIEANKNEYPLYNNYRKLMINEKRNTLGITRT